MSGDQLRAVMAAIIFAGGLSTDTFYPEDAVRKADEILSAVRLNRPTL